MSSDSVNWAHTGLAGENGNRKNGKNGHVSADPQPGASGADDTSPPFDPSLNTPEEFIPTGDELLDAALQALHDEVAFILMHRPDEPETFAERLSRLLDRLQAVITIKGPHRPRAIRMLLSIEAKYWMAAYMFSEWGDLLNFMYSIVRDLNDPELLGEFMEVWGIYYTLHQRNRRALIAFEWSEELAASVDENQRMLFRVERFNNEVMEMGPPDAIAQATELLGRARELNSTYFQARIYHSLARLFRYKAPENAEGKKQAFSYGQQALCYYLADPEDWSLIAQLITTLFAAIDPANATYRAQLIAYQERVTQRANFNPWLRAKMLHSYAAMHYDQGNPDSARAYALQAWWYHQRLGDHFGCAITRHVVGLAQRELKRWSLAERHFNQVMKFYQAHGEDYYYVRAHIARSMIPYRQQQWTEALRAFEESRALVEDCLHDHGARQGLLDEIDGYLNTIRQHLAEA